MSSKLVRVSQKGNMAKIGQDLDNSEWYYLSEPASKFIKTISVGEVVSFETENDKSKDRPVIMRINKSDSSGVKTEAQRTASSVTSPGARVTSTRSESVDERQASIVRQTVLKATATTLQGIGAAGHLDQNNWQPIAEQVFKYYLGLVEG